MSLLIREPYHNYTLNNDHIVQTAPTYIDCLNAALLILPNIYKPLSKPIALGAGAFRAWTCWTHENINKDWSKLFTAVVATTALAATFFGHPLGMLLATAQELGVELFQLVHILRTTQNFQKIFEHSLNIINDSFYLANFLIGKVELTIASLFFQALVGIYKSQVEFRKGNRVKGSFHLFTTVFRCNQLKEQIDLLNLIKKGSSFSVIKRLGNGAEGRVFLARRSDNTLIAVKEYHPKSLFINGLPFANLFNSFYLHSNGVSKLAIREFNVGKNLDHPNIVKIFDKAVQLDDSGNPHTYIMMEYVETTSEDQNPEGSIKNCLQLMNALKAAFASGYLYTDFHSGNILVDSKGNLKLIDVNGFEELSDHGDITNEEYLKGIVSTIKDFIDTHEKYPEIKTALKAVLKEEKVEELQHQSQRYISQKSLQTYFIPMFEKLAAVLNSFSSPANQKS